MMFSDVDSILSFPREDGDCENVEFEEEDNFLQS